MKEIFIVFSRLLYSIYPFCNKDREELGYQNSYPKKDFFSFHIVLIPLRKVCIQLFSLQQWINSRAERAL